MKERPILFSGAMVRAIIEGRKTMTRRVYKPKTGFPRLDGEQTPTWGGCETDYGPSPYGIPGDRLWVRETWTAGSDSYTPHGNWKDGASAEIIFDADDYRKCMPCNREQYAQWLHFANRHRLYPSKAARQSKPKSPAIHMPRWASRITLEVTAVRVERVQDISATDIEAEGCQRVVPWDSDGEWKKAIAGTFRSLWDSINAKRGYGWSVNPWVWVVEFRRLS